MTECYMAFVFASTMCTFGLIAAGWKRIRMRFWNRLKPVSTMLSATSPLWAVASPVSSVSWLMHLTINQPEKELRNCHHHRYQSLNREGRWLTIDDFATSFLHFSLFSTALWDLPNSRPVHSLMLSSCF